MPAILFAMKLRILNVGQGRTTALVTLLTLLLSGPGPAPVRAQDGLRQQLAVDALVAGMSPAERVGQLFVVPFPGADAEDGSAAARLIDRYHVGGFLLDPANGNFVNDATAAQQVARLTSALHARYAASHDLAIPAFVSLSQRGDAFPGSALHSGMTPLPSQLALGATWSSEDAQVIGALVGRELAAVGINLLLGPGLDVSADPRPSSTGDLGARSFGGSPAWVGRLGSAYIAGVHAGGGGRVATVVGSFPGMGGADRSQTQEVAVVDRSLEQLLEIDLPPFSAVASNEDAAAVTDAMATTHVRFRSIQRQADRPFALDSNGLRYLDGQVEPIGAWRRAGGLRMSPGLGLLTVRRYVDAELSSFSPRRVIREALLAGHDLMFLGGFDSGPTQVLTNTQEIEEGIEWLVGEYEADTEVRESVDSALLRVLGLKQRLYGEFGPEPIQIDQEMAAAETGNGSEAVVQVARDALTLIGPGEGKTVLTPQPGEGILLVVDARQTRECAECEPYLDMDPALLLTVMRQAYGPEGSGTARLRDNSDVDAISFRDLKLWLQDTGAIEPESSPTLLERKPEDRPAAEVGQRMAATRWIVFAMRDVRPGDAPASDAFKLYLASRSAARSGDTEAQRIVALGFDAPYFLDTTEMASLHAYYALYARTPPFIEVALRALFGDVAPRGASPVSVSGVGYDLASRLQPAPNQVVSLEPVGWASGQELGLGDNFRLRTSAIYDQNGNLVPDGTRITLRRYLRSADVFLQDVPVTTLRGRAIASLRAEREGEVEITAVQGSQTLGDPLIVRIRPGPAFDAPELGLPLFGRGLVPVDWGVLLLSLSLILLVGVLVYGIDPETVRSPSLLVRVFLLSLAWGLAGYLLVAAGGIRLEKLPGGARLWPAGWSPAYQAPLLSLFFAAIPVMPSLARAIRVRSSR
jgi:beta-N-acetylhexosaminidase